MHGLGAWLGERLWSTDRRRFWTCFAAIALAVCYAYAPSLDHPPRADHWYYLNDVREAHTLGELVGGYYSYDRVRRFNPGVSELFRPLLFATLGVERWLFGAELRCWQAAGILLHLGVCGWLLLILWRILPGLAAGGAVLWFSTLHSVQEMVIWHHIHGYLVGWNLTLAALYLVWTHAARARPAASLAAAWGLTLLAAFTLEFGVALSIALAAHLLLWRSGGWRRWGWGLAFLIPAASFLLANAWDFRMRFPESKPLELPLLRGSVAQIASCTETFLDWVVLNAAIPLQHWVSASEVMAKRFHMPIVSLWDALLEANGGLWLYATAGLLAWILATRTSRGAAVVLRERLPLLTTLGLLLGAYVYMIVAARMIERGEGVIATNAYASYPATLLLLAGAFALVSAFPEPKGARFRPLVPLLLLALVVDRNAFLVRSANQRLAEQWKGTIRYWRQLDRYVRSHRGEPGFTFAVDPIPPVDTAHYGVHSSQILFSRWIDPVRPRRVVRYDGFRLAEAPPDAEGGSRAQLVESGIGWPPFSIYRHGGHCYGLYYYEWELIPSWIPQYRYLVGGETPEEIHERIPAMRERIERDRERGDYLPNPPVWKLGERGGFTIWRQAARFWALGDEEGDLDPAKANRHQYRRCFAADSHARILEWIEKESPQ